MILLLLCLFSAALSSVLSSLGVQVAMLALVLAVGKNLKVSKTKSMMGYRLRGHHRRKYDSYGHTP